MTAEPEKTAEDFEALMRLSRDMKAASRKLPRQHARYLVDTYYQIQGFRIRLGGQIRAAGDSAEPSGLLAWTARNMRVLENDLKLCLGEFARTYKVGRWLQSLCGIGPVLSAGLLSELDIRKAPTCGQFWRFAGLDPSLVWLGQVKAQSLVHKVVGDGKATEEHLREIGKRTNRHPENIRRLLKDGKLTKKTLTNVLARRPWSNSLKCLCAGKIADSFVKVQGRAKDVYGAIYAAHRAKEAVTNDAGGFAEQAEAAMKAKRYGKETASFKAYTEGKLPPLHLHNRSERHTVKLFLSHLHRVMSVDYHGKEPPLPYAFDRLEGHRHLIEPPNWPGEFPGEALRRLYER